MSSSFFLNSSSKKSISISKKHIRRNIWKKKGNLAAKNAFSLAKSVSTEDSKCFFMQQTTGKKILE